MPRNDVSGFLMACTMVFAGAASAADLAPVTLLYNAHIFTADTAHPYADALAFRGDTILAVGDLSTVEQAAGSANKIDMQGKFIMPGMIDAHAHPIAGGTTLVQATFPDTGDSIAALTAFVKEQMDQKASLGPMDHARRQDGVRYGALSLHLGFTLLGAVFRLS